MKKKSATNEYADMLVFLDGLIEEKADEIESLMVTCSDLHHEVRAREVLLEEKKKITSSEASMFSPNTPSELECFDDDWLSQLDSLKKTCAEKDILLDKAREVQKDQKRLKDFLIKTHEENSSFESEELNVSRETNIQALSIQEMERNRIANDLHDTAVQNLTGLMHKGELCIRLMDIDPIRARMEMSTMIDVARDTIDDIRSSIFELRPASIDDFGLPAAIEDYCNHINPEHKINFVIRTEGKETQISKSAQVNLYRISQEACINIIKHSDATNAEVILKYSETEVTLLIKDNGIGISKEKLKETSKSQKHFGLRILEERAKLAGGKIKLTNIKEGGLSIEVTVPV